MVVHFLGAGKSSEKQAREDDSRRHRALLERIRNFILGVVPNLKKLRLQRSAAQFAEKNSRASS
jgi:hypothetical protein